MTPETASNDAFTEWVHKTRKKKIAREKETASLPHDPAKEIEKSVKTPAKESNPQGVKQEKKPPREISPRRKKVEKQKAIRRLEGKIKEIPPDEPGQLQRTLLANDILDTFRNSPKGYAVWMEEAGLSRSWSGKGESIRPKTLPKLVKALGMTTREFKKKYNPAKSRQQVEKRKIA